MYLKYLQDEYPEEYEKKFGKWPDSYTLCKICDIAFGEHYELCCPKDHKEIDE